MRYIFENVETCNMCGSKSDGHKILGKRLNKSQGKRPKLKNGITTTVCKCNSCGLVYSNPQPVPFDIQDHYGVPPEDYWKEEYFNESEFYFQGEITRLKQLIDFKPGLTSLDIGAGLGKQMKALERAGFNAFGFEPSEPFYERAISKMGIDEKKLKIGMLEDVEYDENSFDFVSFGAVLEHLYNPSLSIEKALKWVKPNGVIHIEVPSSRWFTNKIVNAFYKLNFTDYVANLSPMHEPYHLYEFGLNSFQKNAAKHNYEIAHHEYYVCETYLPKILDNVIKPYMKRTNRGMQLCVWLRKKPISNN